MIEDLKRKNDTEPNFVLEQIKKYESGCESDEQAIKVNLSFLLPYNLDWKHNKTLTLLCGALIQRTTRTECLKRVCFQFLARLLSLSTEDNLGLTKWCLLQRFLQQIAEKENIIFNSIISIDTEKLTEIVQNQSEEDKAVSEWSDLEHELEQLTTLNKTLTTELEETKLRLETIGSKKDKEIQEMKKQHEQINEETQKIIKVRHYHAQERIDLQIERRRLTDLKVLLHNETEALRKTFQSLEGSLNESILEETKRLLPALFVIPEVIPELTQEEEKIYTGVAKEWIADILGMDFSPSNLHSELMDGSVLCRVMNTLKPGCIKKYYPNTKIKLLRQENIGFFIAACESEYGLSPLQIFTADELINGNMKKVLGVLIEIMKLSNLKEL
jgi:antitoxin component of RelBE/YafQ-DinJ toxin-antitoxin module